MPNKPPTSTKNNPFNLNELNLNSPETCSVFFWNRGAVVLFFWSDSDQTFCNFLDDEERKLFGWGSNKSSWCLSFWLKNLVTLLSVTSTGVRKQEIWSPEKLLNLILYIRKKSIYLRISCCSCEVLKHFKVISIT